ncbi:hypothetical protein TRICI_000183 [Trichomonascus ciferrii]|uniref:Uncharacterized protein n=1 Tax=Trichomonascus ciferrii TaxID=44093 RepID=A0A642VE63_9ASCO|nr:hypothetical protein TRICI_000183 [Trichomonascus ciferrii]
MDTSEATSRLRTPNKESSCSCDGLEDALHILVRCGQYENARQVLRQVSPELNLKILLGSKKGLEALVEFIKSVPHQSY